MAAGWVVAGGGGHGWMHAGLAGACGQARADDMGSMAGPAPAVMMSSTAAGSTAAAPVGAADVEVHPGGEHRTPVTPVQSGQAHVQTCQATLPAVPAAPGAALAVLVLLVAVADLAPGGVRWKRAWSWRPPPPRSSSCVWRI